MDQGTLTRRVLAAVLFAAVAVLGPLALSSRQAGAQGGTDFIVDETTVDENGLLPLVSGVYSVTITIVPTTGMGSVMIGVTADDKTHAEICTDVQRIVISGFAFRANCPGDGTGGDESGSSGAGLGFLANGTSVIKITAPYPIDASAFLVPAEYGGGDWSGSYYDVDSTGPTTTTTSSTTTTTTPTGSDEPVPWRETDWGGELVPLGWLFANLVLFSVGVRLGVS